MDSGASAVSASDKTPDTHDTSRLNADYVPEIELVDDNILRIKHDGHENRERITAYRVGSTRYSAVLETVQYGKFQGEDAALLVFHFHFGFREKHLDRYYFATIRIEFEETGDAQFTRPEPRNFANDPEVKMVIPVQIYGNLDPKKKTRTWNLAGSITASAPVPSAPQLSVNPSGGGQNEYSTNYRMNILGELDSNDDHPNFHNAALWTTEENAVHSSGILHNWKSAVVITMPKHPSRPVKATMRIEASAKFSLNPARLWPRRDDPILLVKGVSKGKQYTQNIDFDDPQFPWTDVVRIPAEYEVSAF